MEIFCSTIIPTINRSTLSLSICSVLDQSLRAADFEVIVVNDRGQPLPSMDWQYSPRVRVIETNRRERSVARNVGAAIAMGKYLHFLDDDDLLLPGSLEAFWGLDQSKGRDVIWLYGGYQTVDNGGNLIEQFYPGITGNVFALLVAGESIPFQASLLDARTFHSAGAFDPSPRIIGVEDRDLGRRMAFYGSVAFLPELVAQIRIGEQGSTTNWDTIAESDRWGREKALSMEESLARLRDSAYSGFWRGRVSRACFASSIWNLKRKNLLIAVSRAAAGLFFANWRTLTPDFWRGMGILTNDDSD
jgi:glycosyltransferase involved in cell wall biosynthesis